ncbi:MAG: fatty acid CoA ligase family protein [Bacteroidota bacterium]
MRKADYHIITSDINNVADYLTINADKHPDKPALLHPVRISYRELGQSVSRYSSGLFNCGIRPGTRTLMMVPAGADFFILVFSLLRAGAVPVMIDPGMGIKAMISVLSGLEPEAFIGIPKAHLLRFIDPGIFNSVRIKITTGNIGFRDTITMKKVLNCSSGMPSAHSFGDGDIAAVFYTSGSTGPAKGVIYTAGMLKNQIEATRKQFRIGSDEIDLCTFPLLGLFALCHGNSSVIADMDMVHPAKLNPEKIIGNISEFGCTRMFGSPMILKKLAEYGVKKEIKLLSLRKIISAGAPVHLNILESFGRMISDNAEIHTPYGATEALPVTDITASELSGLISENDQNGSGICVGKPVVPVEIRIIDITDEPLPSWDRVKIMPVNEIGEIVVKGPWVSPCYFRNSHADMVSKIPGENKKEIWHRMGDLGKIDSLGRVWFYGRKSHRVITSDTTLYTIPCEAVFNLHPYVSRSALVGVKHEKSGIRQPVIIIQLKPGFQTDRKLMQELIELKNSSGLTKGISEILFKKKFPVDPRHNAKIFREKLALWAEKRLK